MNAPIRPDFSPMGRTRLYRVWSNAKNRCFNPNNPRYATHGGRAIGMYPAWADDFRVFRAWALAHGYAPGLALNRIDKSKGYTPENCRWSESYSRSHDTRPVTRSDGRHFESLSEAVRETPRAHAYGIHLVCRGTQKTCGGYTWRFDPPEGEAS